MYAIIATGGKQYKVTKGDVVKFEKLNGEAGDKVVFDQVLLVSEKKVTVGDPYIADATVEGKIVEQGKDKKVIVYKYKSKTGYHKKNGHRQPITTVEIEKVLLGGVELEPEKETVSEKLDEVKTAAKKAAKKAGKKVEDKAEEVKKAAEDKAEEIKADAEEKAEKVKEAAKDKAEEIKADAEKKAEELKADAKDKAEEVKEKVEEKAKELKEKAEDALKSDK